MSIGGNIGVCRCAQARRRVGIGAIIAGLALVSGWRGSPAANAGAPDHGVRFIPDVPGQFRALARRADALGFHITTTPDPSMCRHYQGIARVNGSDGTPFFLVTRSGNTPEIPICPDELCCDDSPGEKRNGNLIVFRMDSRDKHGERLRSNRLRKGLHVDATAPPDEDQATIYFAVVEGGLVLRGDDDPVLPRVYQHPGGMQVVGHMMALAMDTPRPYPNGCAPCFLIPDPPEVCDICFDYERASSPALVMFFDVSNPEDPIFKSQFVPVDDDGDPIPFADGIALTPLPGGLFLMAVTEGFEGTDPIYFYRSTLDDLASPDLSWVYVDQVPGPNGDEDAHQSLHFIREDNIHGDLYLAGARGHPAFGSDHDKIDLYLVEGETEDFAPGEQITVTTRYRGQAVTTFPSTGGDRLANLAAATGFYESPSGELIFYATEHDNDGPDGTVKAGEWRHINMVRDNSPTYLPTAKVNGPYEVDEGRTVSLTGLAGPPITKAWIELFHEVDYGGSDFSTFYPVVDYDDYDRDDYDNFGALELQLFPLFWHFDKARSWKWFAPAGCSILTIDRNLDGTLDETRTLVGDGLLHEDPDLSLVLNDAGTDDMDQEVDAVDFLDDCDAYYAAPVELQWDLDVNGSYETTGSPVIFDAIGFDGPSVVHVPARAQHSFGGPPGEATATVTVRNVAPELMQFRLTNGAGQVVNVDVPFVLVNLPVTVTADFSDPGVLDHQSATLDWGDGTVDPHTAFITFDEAFGDGSGAVSHAHSYPLPGSYSVVLSVMDDDGGADSESTDVEVLTPEQAVEEVIDLLDGVIAGTTDNNILKELLKARKALAGNVMGISKDGALTMIRAGIDPAAIAFMLEQAIFRLRLAQSAGADVGTLIALLEQVIAALSSG